ncbi:MAG: EF-hand domain-containing protein [Coleofasciculus sp. G1-WW12-02]|uniref:EF-hand domain-containing protein n=1 Tax=Coleofasciculus sp. G1-WW12-02 TaxID=3068483 RepID=UPI0033055053
MISELRKKKLTKVFNTLDSDGSGVITKADLEKSFESTVAIRGYKPGTSEYQSAYDQSVTQQWNDLATMDSNNDGEVTLEEFIAYYDKPASDPTLNQLIAAGGEVLFSMGDADGSGQIGLSEFKQMNAAWQSDEGQAEATFTQLDQNGDGSISKEEFLAHCKDFFFSDDPKAPGNLILGPV